MDARRPCASLVEVRAEIDRIDRMIISVLGGRATYVREAAAFKTSLDRLSLINGLFSVPCTPDASRFLLIIRQDPSTWSSRPGCPATPAPWWRGRTATGEEPSVEAGNCDLEIVARS